jgi:glutamyl-tRNA synthetase
MRELSVDELTSRLEAFTGRAGLRAAVEISQEKIQTLADFWPLAGFIFDGPGDDEKARSKWLGEEGLATLGAAREVLAGVGEPFDVAGVQAALDVLVAERGLKPKDVFQPIRVALAGTTVSPGIYETVCVLGREETLSRMDRAISEGRAG